MKRLHVVLSLILCLGLCFGQASKPAMQDDGGFMGWVHNAWNTVQEQGKASAEQLVRQWPKRFQEVKNSVADLNKKARDRINAMDLEQKRAMLLELWRIRKSLDIMALLKPEVLQSLTGLDTSGLKSLETQAANLTAFVSQKIHGQH